jgi:hypothetical protein
MKILKKTRMKMLASFFKEECQSTNSMTLVEISKNIRMTNLQLEFEEKF